MLRYTRLVSPTKESTLWRLISTRDWPEDAKELEAARLKIGAPKAAYRDLGTREAALVLWDSQIDRARELGALIGGADRLYEIEQQKRGYPSSSPIEVEYEQSTRTEKE